MSTKRRVQGEQQQHIAQACNLQESLLFTLRDVPVPHISPSITQGTPQLSQSKSTQQEAEPQQVSLAWPLFGCALSGGYEFNKYS